jgi:hypothetical protein
MQKNNCSNANRSPANIAITGVKKINEACEEIWQMHRARWMELLGNTLGMLTVQQTLTAYLRNLTAEEMTKWKQKPTSIKTLES